MDGDQGHHEPQRSRIDGRMGSCTRRCVLIRDTAEPTSTPLQFSTVSRQFFLARYCADYVFALIRTHKKCGLSGTLPRCQKKYYARISFPHIFNSVVTRLLALALCIVISGSVMRYYVLTQFLRENLSAIVESQ